MNTQMNTALAERTPFLLPDVVTGSDFSQEELAEDMEGLDLGFQRIKIPSGGQLQFEIPTDDPDNPDYSKTLEGVIVHSHNSNAYWPGGHQDEAKNGPPQCQSMDGVQGYGDPGLLCEACGNNQFGSSGKGKICSATRS